MPLRSLRARITAAALVAVCVAMAAVAFVLVRYVRVSLEHEMDARLVADSDQVLALLPALGQIRVEDNSVIGDPAGRSIQVLTPEGAVTGSQVYASEADRRPLLTAPFPWESESLPRTMTVDVTDSGAHRIRVTEINGDPSPRFLVVARPLSSVDNAVATMTRALAVGLSLIVAAFGWMIWLMVGRTLRPVEELRRAVSDISATDRSRRVETTDRGTEIDQLAATMNDLLDRLEVASVREHQLVADASHELRSPLAAVRALVETRTGLVGDAAAEHDAHTLDAIARIQALIDGLLDLWRYDSLTHGDGDGSAFDRDEPAYRRLVDLDDLVLEQANLLRRTTRLDIDTSRVSGGQLMGNPEALRRMVENLCSNAARHASTTVRFVVEERDDSVLLEVADDGVGISEADRARVFDRFTRLAEARERDQGGSGLGLAIVKGIVVGHDGTIEVTSLADGSGSAFVARFALVP